MKLNTLSLVFCMLLIISLAGSCSLNQNKILVEVYLINADGQNISQSYIDVDLNFTISKTDTPPRKYYSFTYNFSYNSWNNSFELGIPKKSCITPTLVYKIHLDNTEIGNFLVDFDAECHFNGISDSSGVLEKSEGIYRLSIKM